VRYGCAGVLVVFAACGAGAPAPPAPAVIPGIAAPHLETSTINGVFYYNQIAPSGAVLVKPDWTQALVRVFAPDGERRGAGHDDGSFSVPGVPDGPYALQFNTIHVVSGAQAPDLSFDNLGRPGVATATQATPLVLNVSGLDPWQDGDELELFSAGAAAQADFLDTPGATGLPAAGDTALTALTVDWSRVDDSGLIDGTKLDDAALLQRVRRASTTGVVYASLGEIFSPAPFTQHDGETTTLSGAFASVPQETVTLTHDAGAFASYRAEVHPDAVIAGHELAIAALPGGADVPHGVYAYEPPALLHLELPPDSAGSIALGDLTYGAPFPADWGLFGTAETHFTVGYTLAGTSTPATFDALIAVEDPLADFSAASIAPRVGPAGAPLLDGMDALQTLGGVALTPTLTWTPPAAPAGGSIAGYFVNVYRLDAAAGATTSTFIALFVTPYPTLRIDPGVLAAGATYVVNVRSFVGAGLDLAGHPYRTVVPRAFADLYSAPFSVAAPGS
jgi:hypothetical protein